MPSEAPRNSSLVTLGLRSGKAVTETPDSVALYRDQDRRVKLFIPSGILQDVKRLPLKKAKAAVGKKVSKG